MEEQEKPESQSTAQSVGDRLRAAREAAGMSRSDVASSTRVAERHLAAIEENRFTDLAAPTYAVGFSRAYARAVGLDESDIAKRVRRQLDASSYSRPATVPSFEPGDPARVPPRRLAWVAALLVIVAVAVVYFYFNSYLSPEGQLPDLTSDQPQAAAKPNPSKSPSAAMVAAQGPVVLTALAPNVWLKVTDGDGNQLIQKELAQNESYTVPADAKAPQLRTGRPDALQISVGGRVLPMLSDKPKLVSGVSLVAASLAERAGTNTGPSGAVTPVPAGSASSAPDPVPAHKSTRATMRRNGAVSQPSMDDLLDGAAQQPNPRAGNGISPPTPAADNPVSTNP